MISVKNSSNQDLVLLGRLLGRGDGFFVSLLDSSAFRTTFLGSLVARTDGVSLISNDLSTSLFDLGLVDVLHQDTLVLEDVTLDLQVQRVVHVLVDLASFTVLAEHATENAHTTQPNDLGGHASFTGTATLTSALVTTLALSLSHQANTGAAVDFDGLLEDQAVLDELADSLAGVGVGDFGGLVGVHPNLALTGLQDASGEATLQKQARPVMGGER